MVWGLDGVDEYQWNITEISGNKVAEPSIYNFILIVDDFAERSN